MRLPTAIVPFSALGLLAGSLVLAAPASADDQFSDAELMQICQDGWLPGGTTGGPCTFEPAGESPTEIGWHRVGNPVTNCTEGATQPVKRTEGEVKTFTETWTVSGGIELGLTEDIKISAGAEYSETRSVSKEERTEITAQPGRKNEVTLGTEYALQTGRMVVPIEIWESLADGGGNYAWEDHYVDVVNHRVPTGYLEGGQNEVACGDPFTVDPDF